MNLIDKIKELPDVSFINNDTLEDTLNQLKSWYEEAYHKETGEKKTLDDGDPEKLKLDAVGMMIHQVKEYINFVGKQNLIKYATGAFLENITASLQIFRNPGTAASVTIRFFLSEPREDVYVIPAGTRCATEDDVYFVVPDNTEIAAGNQYTDVRCVCDSAGEDGNEYPPGKVNILVDPLPYIEFIQNTDTSGGGRDQESDDDLAERFLLTPSAFNAWGGENYYTYHLKNCDGNIGDVIAVSPEPCITDVYFITKDGSIPDDDEIARAQLYIDDVCAREVGDIITVKKPDSVEFSIDFDYFINESDRERVLAIRDAVQSAVNEYKKWQTEKFGRDVSPDMLSYLVMKAGAKRLVVRNPKFTIVDPVQIPVCDIAELSYGGLEND